MQLDVQTFFGLCCLSDLLLSAYGLVLWRTQRIAGLGLIAAAFLSHAASFCLSLASQRFSPWLTTLPANVLLTLMLALLAEGFARFLGQRPVRAASAGVVVIALLAWPLMLGLWPGNLAIRVTVMSALIILMAGVLAWHFFRDRTLPRAVRRIMELWSLTMIVLTLARGVTTWLDPATTLFETNTMEALYLLSTYLGLTFLVVMLAIMISLRLRAELARALAVKETHLQEQRQFIHLVHHEFRTPLAVISRSIEMLELLLETPAQALRSRLDHIRDAAGRMGALIERFLSDARHEEAVLSRERLDLGQLIAQVIDRYRPFAPPERFIIDPPPRLPCEGDRQMIGIILSNLIDNALKYSPADAPIEVALAERDERIVLTVADRGIGLPAGERGKIGEKFFRASNASGMAPGVGLGLHAAHRLAARHGGTLTLAPRENGGTCATLVLPRAERARAR